MALYAIVTLRYTAPLERILKTVEKHRAYLRELHQQGKMVASGPFVPREGGALILRIEDASEVERLRAKDPYRIESLCTETVHVWDPNIGREGLDSLAKPS
jgi:uncharacterized protein YciI